MPDWNQFILPYSSGKITGEPNDAIIERTVLRNRRWSTGTYILRLLSEAAQSLFWDRGTYFIDRDILAAPLRHAITIEATDSAPILHLAVLFSLPLHQRRHSSRLYDIATYLFPYPHDFLADGAVAHGSASALRPPSTEYGLNKFAFRAHLDILTL